MRIWNVDEPLCDLLLQSQAFPVRLRAEVGDEQYHAHTSAREFIPLSVEAGTRTRVIGRPYYVETHRGAGGVPRERRIGEAEAYFYREDRILLLWRCRLLEPFQLEPTDAASDLNLAALWEGFERFLAARFPHATAVVTPSWNLPYASDDWRRFLQAHRFVRPSPAGLSGMAFIRP